MHQNRGLLLLLWEEGDKKEKRGKKKGRKEERKRERERKRTWLVTAAAVLAVGQAEESPKA